MPADLPFREGHETEEYWQAGYSAAMDEADGVVADKDAFIGEQSALIRVLMDHVNWNDVSDDVRNRCADYL